MKLNNKRSSAPEEVTDEKAHKLVDSLAGSLRMLQERLGINDDIVFRSFDAQIIGPIRAFICYNSGLVGQAMIHEHILKPLMEVGNNERRAPDTSINQLSLALSQILNASSVREIRTIEEATNEILSGQTALFLDGFDSALSIETRDVEHRPISEPATEAVVRGPREGFTEMIELNTALIRRKITNPDLVFEKMTLGSKTKTKIRLAYMKGIADPDLVAEVKTRLSRISPNSVLESGYLEQLIEDHPFTIFPTIGNSERPDSVAMKLLEGKVAILCDGTPFVLIVPHFFVESLHVSEDYYMRPYIANFVILLRYIALLLTVYTPALYVSLTSYHQGMIPTILLTTIAATEERVPFPVILEVILIGVAFELIREAGIRMPRPIGSAMTIVGALIIGEAAVQAGLVSAPMVINMAVTGISGILIPALNSVVLFTRIFLLLLAGGLGFYGILIGSLIIVSHICSLQSFGYPYLSPIAPFRSKGWNNTFMRIPIRLKKKWLRQGR
ncbi:spore germination protein [Cohnella sp. CFH 77786]|nr:spore germination protein [Cohnella sp. CFH 77786]